MSKIDREQAAQKVAAISGGKMNANRLGMYLPLSPAALSGHLNEGTMPAHAFSDRATGIAYQPVVPQLKRREKMRGLAKFNQVFEAKGLKELDPKLNIRFPQNLPQNADGMYNKNFNGMGPLVRLTPPSSSSNLINTAGHEYQHHNSLGGGAKPYIPSDTYGDQAHNTKKKYLTYRMHPEETLAFHAGDLAEENMLFGGQTEHDVAKRINKGAKVGGKLHNPESVFLGHSPNFSQTNTILDNKKNMLLRNVPDYKEAKRQHFDHIRKEIAKINANTPNASKKAPQSHWKSFLKKIGKLGKGASLGAGIAGTALQAKDMKRSYDRAKKVGASPLAGMLSPIGIAPITERLKDGSVYNHSTGKRTYDKGREPV